MRPGNKREDLALNEGFPPHQIYGVTCLLEEFAEDGEDLLFWFLLWESARRDLGHIRLSLDQSALNRDLDGWVSPTGKEPGAFIGADIDTLKSRVPSLIQKHAGLFQEDTAPFLLDQNCLYTRRQYQREKRLTLLLDELLERQPFFSRWLPSDLPEYAGPLQEILSHLRFSSLSILSGGPGTGKTTLLVGMVQALRQLSEIQDQPSPRILLTAPTGRAAKRMEEALSTGGVSGYEAQTLHRLLRLRWRRRAGSGEGVRISADLVVVDEASMVDLTLMTCLLEALEPGTALLLIGDRDQLPSVESGALLGDLLKGYKEKEHRLNGRVTLLEKVYRSDRSIIDFASAILEGTPPDLDMPGIYRGSLPGDYAGRNALIVRWLQDYPSEGAGYPFPRDQWKQAASGVETQLKSLEDQIILCPGRRGFWGVEHLNRVLSQGFSRGEVFHGMPLMVLQNDYELGLFNGDRGKVLFFDRQPFAVFPGEEEPRFVPLSLLNHWECSYAMTVHKSQGSEFHRVRIVLPEESGPLLYRELLYTAVTRAKKDLELWEDGKSLEICLKREMIRSSGISDYLVSPK